MPNKTKRSTDRRWKFGQLDSSFDGIFFATVYSGHAYSTDTCLGDVTYRADSNGRQYLELTER